MAKSLDGKVAVVTGASRNLGRAFSEMLGTEGASVVVHFNTQTKSLRLTILLPWFTSRVPKR
jgi:NAD(P)-dependent dehydrogenase (short-subunit alcohol dehydrogenase family)